MEKKVASEPLTEKSTLAITKWDGHQMDLEARQAFDVIFSDK